MYKNMDQLDFQPPFYVLSRFYYQPIFTKHLLVKSFIFFSRLLCNFSNFELSCVPFMFVMFTVYVHFHFIYVSFICESSKGVVHRTQYESFDREVSGILNLFRIF